MASRTTKSIQTGGDDSRRMYCLLPATSEKDRVVAPKHSESIQDYGLQRDACEASL
jgi:hypothetical protein